MFYTAKNRLVFCCFFVACLQRIFFLRWAQAYIL